MWWIAIQFQPLEREPSSENLELNKEAWGEEYEFQPLEREPSSENH